MSRRTSAQAFLNTLPGSDDPILMVAESTSDDRDPTWAASQEATSSQVNRASSPSHVNPSSDGIEYPDDFESYTPMELARLEVIGDWRGIAARFLEPLKPEVKFGWCKLVKMKTNKTVDVGKPWNSRKGYIQYSLPGFNKV